MGPQPMACSTTLPTWSVHVDARVADREAHAVRAHEILTRIRQARLPGLKAEREADGRRDEIAVESLEAARQECKHDARTGILLSDLCQGLFARLDGRLQDLRDRQVGAHSVVSALGHGLGHRDDRLLRLLRHRALRVEDAVLERLAELRRRRIVLAREPLAEPAKHLREHDARAAARAKDSSRRDTAGQPADAVVLRMRERHDGRPHRAQDVRARHVPGALERIDLLILQQELAVRTRYHALEVTARDYLSISCHVHHTRFFLLPWPRQNRNATFYYNSRRERKHLYFHENIRYLSKKDGKLTCRKKKSPKAKISLAIRAKNSYHRCMCQNHIIHVK